MSESHNSFREAIEKLIQDQLKLHEQIDLLLERIKKMSAGGVTSDESRVAAAKLSGEVERRAAEAKKRDEEWRAARLAAAQRFDEALARLKRKIEEVFGPPTPGPA